MATIFVSLFCFSAFSLVTAQQRQSNIALGSALSPTTNPTSWLSPSGRFAFGFYPEGSGFAVGIWLTTIPNKTIVWTAHRNDPPVSIDTRLVLNNNGWLLLIGPGDQVKPISNASEPASSASMLDSGNFVLYRSSSRILWQSFDYPTDTILVGQSLRVNTVLISSASRINHSTGGFTLVMHFDGILTNVPMIRTNTAHDIYWQSDTAGQGDNVSTNLGDDGRIYMLNSTGFNIKNLTDGRHPRDPSVTYRVTLDVDGIFRLYSHDLSSNSGSTTTILWEPFKDGCMVKGLCGLNGFCTLMDTQAVCSCPPGFIFVDPDYPFRGCGRNFTRPSCARNKEENIRYSMLSLENTAWLDEPYAFYMSMTKDECRESCLQDCYCEAALYSNEICNKQKLPLSFGRRSVSSGTTATTAFIKVGNGSPANTDEPSIPTGTLANRRRGVRMEILIACIAVAAGSFIGFAIFYFFVYRRLRLREAGRLWKAMVKDSHNLMPKLLPDIISSIVILKGDVGVGTIRQSNFSPVTAQQRQSNITLGSALSPTANPTSWLSPSGRFAFGFYPEGSGFAVGIWLTTIPNKTIVWTAHRNDPPISIDTRLVLNNSGWLLLIGPGDQVKPISNASEPASSASMLDSGNFVLYRSSSRILWQSFDYPTDTILVGQPLRVDTVLISSASRINHSTGGFTLVMHFDGSLANVPMIRTTTVNDIYWHSDTVGQGYNVSTNLGDDGRIYMLNSTGFNIKNLTDGRHPRDPSVTYCVTLDVDGIFRLYSHDFSSNSGSTTTILWEPFTDGCMVKGLCGLNGFCTLMDTKAVCSCPPGFIFVDPDYQFRGCVWNFTRPSCARNKKDNIRYSMFSLENTAWLDEPYAFNWSMTKDECRESCLQDCYCEAALYSNEKCNKQKLPLSFGRTSVSSGTTSTTAFIKVGNGSPANTDEPSIWTGTLSNRTRGVRMEILIACIALASGSFIGFAIFYFLVHRRHRLSVCFFSDEEKK
ncbi:hypothetical protein MRB53_008488 [Persea americana]|uniref:Uncharacterized protein n=1 Tax=Persea americana TaxID=3435 RepID=A0ACC2MM85_PERAE|nr:hypothetical protein MRB53_008488 [Persea americana]